MATACNRPLGDEDLDHLTNGTEHRTINDSLREQYGAIAESNLAKLYDEILEKRNTELVATAALADTKANEVLGTRPLTERHQAVRDELDQLRPTKISPIERKAAINAGKELGLSPARYIGTPDITRFPKDRIREVMEYLNDNNIPRCFTRCDLVGQVQFVDNLLLATEGYQGAHQRMHNKTQDKFINTIYIFMDSKGQCPSGQVLKEILSHEICHANSYRFAEFIENNPAAFSKAVASQTMTGPPSQYSYEANRQEWLSECYKYYITDQTNLSSEMIEFLKSVSEYYSRL